MYTIVDIRRKCLIDQSMFFVERPLGGQKYRWEVIDPLAAKMLAEGKTYGEIARIMGIPFSTLKSRAGLHKKQREIVRSVEDERRFDWVNSLPPTHPISRAVASLKMVK